MYSARSVFSWHSIVLRVSASFNLRCKSSVYKSWARILVRRFSQEWQDGAFDESFRQRKEGSLQNYFSKSSLSNNSSLNRSSPQLLKYLTSYNFLVRSRSAGILILSSADITSPSKSLSSIGVAKAKLNFSINSKVLLCIFMFEFFVRDWCLPFFLELADLSLSCKSENYSNNSSL